MIRGFKQGSKITTSHLLALVPTLSKKCKAVIPVTSRLDYAFLASEIIFCLVFICFTFYLFPSALLTLWNLILICDLKLFASHLVSRSAVSKVFWSYTPICEKILRIYFLFYRFPYILYTYTSRNMHTNY